MIEQTLEVEIDEALGCRRYERTGEPTRGYRNGGRIKTAQSVVDFTAPQVMGKLELFVCKVWRNLPDRAGDKDRG